MDNYLIKNKLTGPDPITEKQFFDETPLEDIGLKGYSGTTMSHWKKAVEEAVSRWNG